MGIVESSIGLIAVLFFYLRYRMSSYELALERRERMIADVNKILQDHTVGDQTRSVALYMFNKSPTSGHVPKMFLRAAWRLLVGRKKTSHGFTNHEQTLLRRLFVDHLLPINALAGVHWYVLGAIVALIVFFFAGIAHITKLETIKSAFAVKLIDDYRTSKLAF